MNIIPTKSPRHPRFILIPIAIIAVCVILLAFPFRDGLKLLLNQLFQLSENANSYEYSRFAVPDGVSITPATIALVTAGCALLLIPLFSESRFIPLAIMLGSALFQAWIGLSLPIWANAALFVYLFTLMTTDRKRLHIPALCLCIVLCSYILLPGTDDTVERLSEKARDVISGVFSGSEGGTDADESGIPDARRENNRSLDYGYDSAESDADFRLVTVEKQEISLPHTVDILKIALMCLLIPLVIIAPFAPFAWMSIRRKKALELRKTFETLPPKQAVIAAFRHINAYLDFADGETPNCLYSERELHGAFSADEYRKRYLSSARIFDEAAYSEHELTEKHLAGMIELLNETERVITDNAGFAKLFRLRYILCLYTK